MKRYVFLIAYEPTAWDEQPPEVQEGYVRDHEAFSAYVAQNGRELGSAPLADTDQATTVRRSAEGVAITDGPFVETTEMIGGYYDVELPDLDTAIAAAQLLPAAYSVEIRPTIEIG